MNSDIVKPMPPTMPTSASPPVVSLAARFARPCRSDDRDSRHDAERLARPQPDDDPDEDPQSSPVRSAPPSATPAFASANSGITPNATHGCSACIEPLDRRHRLASCRRDRVEPRSSRSCSVAIVELGPGAAWVASAKPDGPNHGRTA